MKLDFTADRRLMKDSATGGTSGSGTQAVTQQMIDAALYDYNQAKKANDQAKIAAATQKILELAQQGNLLDAAADGAGKIATTAIDLETERAKKRQDAAQQATLTDIQLQSTRGSAVVTSEQNAANAIFQSNMIGPNLEKTWYSTLKVFGGIIDKFFHTHISEWAEQKLAEVKFPTMDTAGIRGVNTTITSDAGSDRLDKQTNDAIATLSADQGEVNAMVGRMSAALATRNGGNTAPATAAKPAHDLTLQTVNSDIAALRKSGAITSNVDLSGAVARAAASDGKPETLSIKDLPDLSARVEAKAGKTAAAAVTEKLTLEMR